MPSKFAAAIRHCFGKFLGFHSARAGCTLPTTQLYNCARLVTAASLIQAVEPIAIGRLGWGMRMETSVLVSRSTKAGKKDSSRDRRAGSSTIKKVVSLQLLRA